MIYSWDRLEPRIGRGSAQVHSRRPIIKLSNQHFYKHDSFALLGAAPLDAVILRLGRHAILLHEDPLDEFYVTTVGLGLPGQGLGMPHLLLCQFVSVRQTPRHIRSQRDRTRTAHWPSEQLTNQTAFVPQTFRLPRPFTVPVCCLVPNSLAPRLVKACFSRAQPAASSWRTRFGYFKLRPAPCAWPRQSDYIYWPMTICCPQKGAHFQSIFIRHG